MSRFYLLPTTDIHLVLDEAIHDGQQFVLKFNYRGQISGFEPSKVSKCVEKPSIIDVDIDYDPNDTDKKMEIIVTAKEKGLSFIRIRYDLESQDDDGNPMCLLHNPNINKICILLYARTKRIYPTTILRAKPGWFSSSR